MKCQHFLESETLLRGMATFEQRLHWRARGRAMHERQRFLQRWQLERGEQLGRQPLVNRAKIAIERLIGQLAKA